MNLVSSLIADVPDWPKSGVVFKDITPLLASPEGFRQAVDAIVASAPEAIDVVVGMEARGFIFAAPVALALGAGFVPVRKPGKLPRPVLSESFDLEYGTTCARRGRRARHRRHRGSHGSVVETARRGTCARERAPRAHSPRRQGKAR